MGRSSWQVLVLVSIVTALIAVCWQLVQLRQKIEVDSGARFGIYDVLVEKENGSFNIRIGQNTHCNRSIVIVEGFAPLAGIGGASNVERSGAISIGDAFAIIDGHAVLGAPFQEVVGVLRSTGNAPTNITFIRPSEAPCSMLSERLRCPYSICTTPPQSSTYPSTLVVLLGNARGGKVAWDSLEKNLLSPLRADLALAFGSTSKWPAQLTERAKYQWVLDEPRNWTSVLDAVAKEEGDSRGKRWRRHARKCKGKGLYGPATLDGQEEPGSGVIIFAFRNWLLHGSRRTDGQHAELPVSSTSECLKTLETYDRIVLTRADHVYACDHPDVDVAPAHFLPGQEELPTVWIPAGEDYDGITDRHHIFNGKQDARSVLDVLRWLVRQKSKLELHSCLNPEGCLMEYFRSAGVASRIRRFSRTMYTVKVDGVDTTRWTEGADHWAPVKGQEGLIAKYPDEYAMATAECNRRTANF